MRREYDFSKGVRGALIPPEPGKARITIRLDTSVLEWFKEKVDAAGGGNYQTMINAVLREHIAQTEAAETTEPVDLMEALERLIARAKAGRPASGRSASGGRSRKGGTPAA